MRLKARRHQASTIAADLREQILSGELKPQARIPTEHALARKFHVSRGTVIRSLRQLEHEGLLWTRHGDGRFVVDPAMRTKTATIGIVLPNVSVFGHPVTTAHLAGMREVCEAEHYHAEVFGFNPQIANRGLSGVMERLDPSRLDGAIFTADAVPLDRAAELARRIPIVWMSRALGVPRTTGVAPDVLCGTIDAANHLIALGHRNIAIVTVAADRIQGVQQRDGLRAAMRPLMAKNAGRMHVINAGSNMATEWLHEFHEHLHGPDRSTAVMFGSDDLAIAGLRVIADLKLKVPQDISVVGMSDTLHPPQAPVPMTTIRIDHQRCAREAASILVKMINDPHLTPEPTMVPVELIVRESTTRPLDRKE
jgi:GntR family transcriptional regulator of arabinose operon